MESNRASPLLSLPPELRNRIQKYVVGGKTLHIGTTRKKGVLKACISRGPRSYSLNVLRTCRQIYAETTLLPYVTNVFSFDHPRSMKVALSHVGLIQRRQITKIELESRGHLGLMEMKSKAKFFSNLDKTRKLYSGALTGLESIHVNIIKTKYLSWNVMQKLSTRKQLNAMFFTGTVDITIEEVAVSPHSWSSDLSQ